MDTVLEARAQGLQGAGIGARQGATKGCLPFCWSFSEYFPSGSCYWAEWPESRLTQAGEAGPSTRGLVGNLKK